MTDSEDSQSGYDKVLRDTLLQRTGRNFQRELDHAPLPTAPKRMNKEEAANLIFDNILKKREQRMVQSEQPPVSEPDSTPLPASVHGDAALTISENRPTSISGTYGEILDSILWGEEENAPPEPTWSDLRSTVAENAESAPPSPNYQNILEKTLVNRTAKPPVAAPKKQSISSISQTFSSALDAVLKDDPLPPPEAKIPPRKGKASPSDGLTQTVYNQQLDEILWPSEAKKK
ncbi:MAG: hypothetical protein IV090_03430 [Candidatus Sericytochromatia bacterium]|nr:hypothetical protein [Candidatus Sericytochromatia bacterium]